MKRWGKTDRIRCTYCGFWNEKSATQCTTCGKIIDSPLIRAFKSVKFTLYCVVLSIISFFMLIIAIEDVDYSYYSYLRWIISFTSFFLMAFFIWKGKILPFLLFSLILVLFNPLNYPSFEKGEWQIIDVIVAVLFIVTAILINSYYLTLKIKGTTFLLILVLGGIFFMYFLLSPSESTYYYQSPEEAYMSHIMLKQCAISILIYMSIGGAIFFGVKDEEEK